MNRFARGTLVWALALGFAGAANAELIIDAKPVGGVPPNAAPQRVASPPPVRPANGTPATVARHTDAPKSAGPSKPVQAPLTQAVAPPKPAHALPPTSASPRFSRPGRVIAIGTPPKGALADLEGWAKDVPVDLAVRQVLPQGWALNQEALKGSAVGGRVSWTGGKGKAWIEVLRGVAQGAGFDAEINWDSRTVVLTPVPAPAPVVVAPPIATWDLDAQHTLRENIEAWAKKAGWNRVVWEGADYPIVAPARFTGDIDSPSGPLAKIIEAYEGSDQPLRVTLSTWDKVIHVSNKNFRSVVVEAQTAQSVDPAAFRSSARTKEAREAEALAPRR